MSFSMESGGLNVPEAAPQPALEALSLTSLVKMPHSELLAQLVAPRGTGDRSAPLSKDRSGDDAPLKLPPGEQSTAPLALPHGLGSSDIAPLSKNRSGDCAPLSKLARCRGY